MKTLSPPFEELSPDELVSLTELFGALPKVWRITIGNEADPMFYEIEVYAEDQADATKQAQKIIHWMSGMLPGDEGRDGFKLHHPPDMRLRSHRLRFNKGAALIAKVEQVLI